MADDLIQPVAGSTPPAPQTPSKPAAEASPTPAPADTGNGSIPPAVAKIPAFQALLVGSPAAFSTPINSKNPSIDAIWDAREKLNSVGVAFYRSLSGDTGVVFNALHVHPETLKQADKAGKLAQVAPPFEQVETALTSNPAKHPILNPNFQPPQALPTAPTPLPPQSGNTPTPPPPASVQNKLQSTRDSLLKPGSPTSGPGAGAGRVLAAINKPVV